MGEVLKRRLKMSKFESPQQEAMLGLLVAANQVRALIDKIGDDNGISPEQYNILRILRGVYPEGHSCGEIGNRMLDRSPDITRRLDSLLKLGLVERTRDENDRRVVVTKITQQGLALLDKLADTFSLTRLERLQTLTPKDCQELVRICEKLIEDGACG